MTNTKSLSSSSSSLYESSSNIELANNINVHVVGIEEGNIVGGSGGDPTPVAVVVNNNLGDDDDNNNNNGMGDDNDDNEFIIEPEVQIPFEATEEFHEKLVAMLLHHKGRSRLWDWVPFIGMFRDVRRRIPFYASDIYQGVHPQSIISILFMFFCSIAPALTFGVHLKDKTRGVFGVTEVLFSTSLAGMIFALIGGQPIVIVGVTGPVVIVITTVYELANKFHLPFLQWYCVIGYWSAVMHILLAIFNACNLVKFVTRFTDEIFGVLIGVIFIQDGITALVKYFKHYTMEVALFCFIIAIGYFYLSYSLHYARSWEYLPRIICKILAGAAVPIGIAIFTAVVYIPKLRDVNIPFLDVPDGFKPTMTRDWVVNYTGSNVLPVWAYFAAALPALILTALFFFDHNVSSLLSQRAEFKLKKGPAFHWDIFIIGVIMAIFSVIGLPFTTGLIPQAPLHVMSLATVRKIEDPNGKEREQIVRVRENRITGFMQSLIILIVTLFGQKALRIIPHAIFTVGIFLFMGMTGFDGNQFADRVKLWFRHPLFKNTYPHTFLQRVPMTHIIIYTIIQIICWGIIYAITWTPAAIGFPILILVLVPLRKWLLPFLFTKEQLYYLDNHEAGHIELYDSSRDKEYQRRRLVDIIHHCICRVTQPVKQKVGGWYRATRSTLRTRFKRNGNRELSSLSV